MCDERTEQLEDLIRHIDLHDSYFASGYWKMTTEQKALWREVTDNPEPVTPDIYMSLRRASGYLNPVEIAALKEENAKLKRANQRLQRFGK